VRVLIVTDAWYPQVNGVVRTLTAMRDEMIAMGDEVHMLTPEGFTSIPCPTYPEIRLAIATTTALGLNRADCRAFALQRSWTESANIFRSYLHEFEQHLLANAKTKLRATRRRGERL